MYASDALDQFMEENGITDNEDQQYLNLLLESGEEEYAGMLIVSCTVVISLLDSSVYHSTPSDTIIGLSSPSFEMQEIAVYYP